MASIAAATGQGGEIITAAVMDGEATTTMARVGGGNSVAKGLAGVIEKVMGLVGGARAEARWSSASE